MDFNIYIKRESVHQKFVILALYIDNSIVVGNDINFFHDTKRCLAIGFEMTNEGLIKEGRCKLQWFTFMTKQCFFLGYILFKCLW
jgi:hypothetical protein